MSSNVSIACRQHDHHRCINDALTIAQDICKSKGSRLTKLREQVLKIVWQSHKPLGAYSVMDILAEQSTRRVAPPTVYRALDFLLEHGLIHRINLLNAFVGCTRPQQQHANNFLICQDCGVAIEFSTTALDCAISSALAQFDFSLIGQSVELLGQCQQCQDQDAGEVS
jgi:Fur family zinc uptake transcriptional regulator